MSAAIFIRSHSSDFCWLSYCLKSIHKYARDFSEIVVALPDGHNLPLTAERVVFVPDLQPGYMGQQVSKLYADHYTDAENIVMMDSDSVFNQPVTPDLWFRDGKPIWMMTPMNKVSPDAVAAWAPVLEKFFGIAPSYEFMRRIGQCIPRWALAAFREYCRAQHGCSLEDYIMRQPGKEFSEFNCIGAYLHGNHHDRIHWHNTETDGVPPSVVSQFFSHGGITPEIRAILEQATA